MILPYNKTTNQQQQKKPSQIRDLNKTLKLLEENIKENLYNLDIGQMS